MESQTAVVVAVAAEDVVDAAVVAVAVVVAVVAAAAEAVAGRMQFNLSLSFRREVYYNIILSML